LFDSDWFVKKRAFSRFNDVLLNKYLCVSWPASRPTLLWGVNVGLFASQVMQWWVRRWTWRATAVTCVSLWLGPILLEWANVGLFTSHKGAMVGLSTDMKFSL